MKKENAVLMETMPPADLDDLIFRDETWLTSDR